MRGLWVALIAAMATSVWAEPVKRTTPAPRWAVKRAQPVRRPLPPPVIQPVLFTQRVAPELGRARLLHVQGMTAYRAGRYESAVQKLTAALYLEPSPELLYQLAQAHRMNGDRAQALEHYVRYLELAPFGAAANDCRAHVEKLSDAP
jgi:hypothetical protein